jgi:hypothetical protein
MVEIKARNIPFTKYDTLVILKKKFLLLKWVEGAFGVKGYYVNEFSDKSLYYCQPALCGDDVRFSIINRSDGQCVPDREHACIPRRYWYEVRPRV